MAAADDTVEPTHLYQPLPESPSLNLNLHISLSRWHLQVDIRLYLLNHG